MTPIHRAMEARMKPSYTLVFKTLPDWPAESVTVTSYDDALDIVAENPSWDVHALITITPCDPAPHEVEIERDLHAALAERDEEIAEQVAHEKAYSQPL